MAGPRPIDTGTEDLLARVEDRVAILSMNRPERRNAFSNPMLRPTVAYRSMKEDLNRADHREATQAFVGKGDSVFEGR